MIIAIDGPAGTGKSTIAKNLAQKLNIAYFDTGAMYRSVTYAIIKNNLNINDEEQIKEFLKNNFHYEMKMQNGRYFYYVNGENVSETIRSTHISNIVSQISSKKYVRECLVPKQRLFAENKNIVCEGRDMGTVVFPNADIKIYLTARVSIRAERRFNELVAKFPQDIGTLDKHQILDEIKKRDEQDSNRKISPLKKAHDAYQLDTSNLTIDQVVKKIIKRINKAKKMKFGYRFVRLLSKIILKVFYRFKVYGQENFIKKAAIVTANHVSFLDPSVLAASVKEEMHFLARDSLFKVPVFGKIISCINAHPISFKESNLTTFKEVNRILKSGKKVVIFPQGTRAKNTKIEKLLPGVGFMINLTKCDVICAYIHGAYEVWGRDKKIPKPFGKISCVFGKPIKYEEFENIEKDKRISFILDRLKSKFIELQSWCNKGCRGPIP